MFQRFLQPLQREAQVANGRYRYGNTHLLELHNLIKDYHGGGSVVRALKGITIQIDRGEFVVVTGKSGSGKSTLINMLTGIDHPTSGEIFVGDTAVHTLNEDQLTAWRGKNVGVIFQSFNLVPTLTVLENVMLPMDVCDTFAQHTFRERALRLLEQVEMTEHAHKLPSATSGGQQQRIAIARALANDPPLIVADEPTGSLDSKTADIVLRIFEDLVAQGKTVLMVTHDTELAQRAQRRIEIVDGTVAEAVRR